MKFKDIPVLIITLDDWQVIYFKGKKFKEDHHLQDFTWFNLGILVMETKTDLSKIMQVYISESDVSDESLLWNYPENMNDLDEEIQEFILKNMEHYCA